MVGQAILYYVIILQLVTPSSPKIVSPRLKLDDLQQPQLPPGFPPSFVKFIVGGVPVTDPTQYPFLVRIIFTNGNQGYVKCGGSIISAKSIVTAAHCLEDYEISDPSSQLHIVAGCLTPLVVTDKLSQSDTCVTVNVESIRIHPNYHKSPELIINDVAVLTLSSELDFGTESQPNRFIQPIKLIPPVDSFEESFENEVTTLGWGCTERDSPTTSGPNNNSDQQLQLQEDITNPLKDEQLHFLTYNLLPHKRCKQLTSNSKGVLCAQFLNDPNAGTCQGDSGSSLICTKKGDSREQYLCGITSHRISHSEEQEVDVFMESYFYRDWILNHPTEPPIRNYTGILLSIVASGWTLFIVLGIILLVYTKWPVVLRAWNSFHDWHSPAASFQAYDSSGNLIECECAKP